MKTNILLILPISVDRSSRKRHTALAAAMTTLVASIWLASTAPAPADTIVLRSGGRIEGEVLREEERDGERVAIIQAANGTELALPVRSIEGVKTDPPALADYEDLKAEAADTIEDHLRLADFCRQNRLSDEREFHLWQIIRLDPDHEEARRGLRFTRLDGQWTTQDQYMRRQGYVRVRNQWRLPHEVELETLREEAEQRVIDWRRQLSNWSKNLQRNRNVDATRAGIRNINDPAAIVPLAELVRDSETRDAKELWLEALLRIDHPAILGPLREIVLLEEDDRIRDRCLKEVVERADAMTLTFFHSHLDPEKNSATVINRSGNALEAIGSEVSVRFLIEALVSARKVKIDPGNSGGGQRIGFGAGNNGGGGLNVGGNQPKETTVYERNPGVLGALRAITKQDFRYERDDWMQWYIDHTTPRGIDLRRSGD